MLDILTEFVRWINFALAAGGLAWLGIRSFLRWKQYAYEVRLMIQTLSFYIFGTALGSAEAALQSSSIGTRTYVFLMANIAMLITLWLTQKRRVLITGAPRDRQRR